MSNARLGRRILRFARQEITGIRKSWGGGALNKRSVSEGLGNHEAAFQTS